MTTTERPRSADDTPIRTPDQRIRVFISSTLKELADERRAVQAAVQRLHMTAVMFELGARPHAPRALYRAYLHQSHVFVGIYHEQYGWIGPGQSVSGLEDEYLQSEGMPRLLYVKRPAEHRDPRLAALLDRVQADAGASYRAFGDAAELTGLVEEDLATLLSERFMVTPVAPPRPAHSAPPVPLTPTVGRDADIARIARMLGAGVRLLTITGPGGIGKSRLALEVARAVADRYSDGVVFVPLEALTEPDMVLRTIAARLQEPDDGTRPILDMLADELAGRHTLLVIDNMEHVAAAAPDVAELLGRCPGVSVLFTSQHVLRLRGEREYHLGPLPVPDDTDRDEVGTVAAVDLFVQRARAADPDFRLTPANRVAVAALVRLLDGLPLAIELAAARTRLLPPAALLARLADRIDVLGSGSVDFPPRQRTLRATLDWSYQLLDPAERILFARMSVFAAGALLDAVEAVCGDEAVPDVLGTVSSLLEKSLLISSSGDVPRVTMLQTVRTRAAEQLAERGEVDALAGRHARWYAAFAEPADVLRHAHAPGHWPLLETEIDNLRAAARWVISRSESSLMVDLARRTWPWMWASGRVGELDDAVEHALAALPADADPAARGYLRYVQSYTRGLQGDFAGALEAVDDALSLYGRTAGAEVPLLVAAARLVRGTLRSGLGRRDGVLDDMDAAVTTARRAGSAWLLGYATSHRGLQRAMAGDTAGARADHEESLAAATTMGAEVLIAQALQQLAMVDVLEHRTADGVARLRRQVAHLRRTRHLEGLANALDTAAAAAVAQERWRVAARAAAAAQALRTRIRIAPWPLMVDYHRSLAATAGRHVGDDLPALTAEAEGTDPWTVIDEALTELQAPAA